MRLPPCGVVAAAALLACATPPAAQEPSSPPSPPRSFGEHPAWDDGKAEVCVYDAEEIVEGETRRFEATAIVVAEHFDSSQMVKREEFDLSLVPVLKCNWVLSIPTGVFRYQQMASLFVRRSDLLAMKAVWSSQEWCGTTFAEWRRDRPGFETRSYWDGEGDQHHQLHPFEDLAENVLFHEQIPLWIRGRKPERARSEKVSVVAKRLGTSRCGVPKISPATIHFDGVKERAGARRIEARLAVDGREELFVLAPEFPFTLVEWRRGDGTTWKLKKSLRIDYWNYSKNQFAGYLETR